MVLNKKNLGFVEIFAAAVKPINYKCSMGIIVKRGYSIFQIDVVTGFFYEFSNKVIYVDQLYMSNTENLILVCKLQKGLYGLKKFP